MLLQIVTWTVASLPILINGYLLLDFFSSEIRGAVSGSFLCVAVVAYAAFLLYLILRCTELPNHVFTPVNKDASFT